MSLRGTVGVSDQVEERMKFLLNRNGSPLGDRLCCLPRRPCKTHFQYHPHLWVIVRAAGGRVVTLNLYLCLLVSLISMISCGSLRTLGKYQSMGGADRFQNLKNQSYTPKGPFHLSWPVDYIELTQPFTPPSNPSHQGVDLGGKRGTPIKAAHNGIVIYTGQKYRGFGKMILIEFNEQWATLYAHLDLISVKEGDIVQVGDMIGQMGDTGRTSGVHLHFELIKDKQPVNPLKYLSRKMTRIGVRGARIGSIFSDVLGGGICFGAAWVHVKRGGARTVPSPLN